MRSRTAIIFTVLAVVVAFSLGASAQTENVLYTFLGGTKSGASPSSGVISDADGNLYGVASVGGAHNYGVVYELSEVLKGKLKGTWKFTILHSFAGGTKDGERPIGNLAMDASGNLYGVTEIGGAHGVGIVYELAKPKTGAWKETVLHSFAVSSSDGNLPAAGLIFDAKGNLYGTTSGGGEFGVGTIYELTPEATAAWKETILHNFSSGNDGILPAAALVMDKKGNLYGTTKYGGGSEGCLGAYAGCGTVFELAKSGSGWSESILYALQNNGYNDGNYPVASVTLDADGNLYGTAYGNPSEDDGDTGWLFQLANSGGSRTYNEVLYLGCYDGCPYGAYPTAGMTLDSSGNVWTVTTVGGLYGGGTLLEMIPATSETWNLNITYQFSGSIGGSYPAATPLVTKTGQLIGTTQQGGNLQCNCGVVYEVTP